MTIDVNVEAVTEEFLEDIDDIMEDTMVQMFILHPKDATALESAKEQADECNAIFYAAPIELHEACDANCIGYDITSNGSLDFVAESTKPLFIEEALLTGEIAAALGDYASGGVILNATHVHPELPGFYLSIGPGYVDTFDTEALNALSMDALLLQSGFPKHSFEEVYTTAKKISDAMFRPEQSIIARATKSSLELFGFRK